jgi:transcriptional regulator of arginine metabolism
MMTKAGRQFAIKEIIRAHPIGTQEDLRREIGKRGFRVTQATLSRDMHELGVSRVAQNGSMRYSLPATSGMTALTPLVNAEVLSIDANESLIVVHTYPGCANTVGEFIDVRRHPDIIGTVAGDNTVLVIPSSMKKTLVIKEYLKHTLIEGAA